MTNMSVIELIDTMVKENPEKLAGLIRSNNKYFHWYWMWLEEKVMNAMDDLIRRGAAIAMCREPRMRNADCSDFEMEIMTLPSARLERKKGEWISVKDKVPGNQNPVIVSVPPHTNLDGDDCVGYVGMAYFTDSAKGGFWCGTDGNVYGAIGIITTPTHWMPLPKPYKESENE